MMPREFFAKLVQVTPFPREAKQKDTTEERAATVRVRKT